MNIFTSAKKENTSEEMPQKTKMENTSEKKAEESHDDEDRSSDEESYDEESYDESNDYEESYDDGEDESTNEEVYEEESTNEEVHEEESVDEGVHEKESVDEEVHEEELVNEKTQNNKPNVKPRSITRNDMNGKGLDGNIPNRDNNKSNTAITNHNKDEYVEVIILEENKIHTIMDNMEFSLLKPLRKEIPCGTMIESIPDDKKFQRGKKGNTYFLVTKDQIGKGLMEASIIEKIEIPKNTWVTNDTRGMIVQTWTGAHFRLYMEEIIIIVPSGTHIQDINGAVAVLGQPMKAKILRQCCNN